MRPKKAGDSQRLGGGDGVDGCRDGLFALLSAVRLEGTAILGLLLVRYNCRPSVKCVAGLQLHI